MNRLNRFLKFILGKKDDKDALRTQVNQINDIDQQPLIPMHQSSSDDDSQNSQNDKRMLNQDIFAQILGSYDKKLIHDQQLDIDQNSDDDNENKENEIPPAPSDNFRRMRDESNRRKSDFYPATKLREDILVDRGQDLTRLAYDGRLASVYGRDREISQIVEILRRRTKRNPVLIGEAGVGKTAIVEALAQMIIEREAPPWIQNKKIISISLFDIIAQTQNYAFGEYAQRLKDIIEALRTKPDEEATNRGRIAFFDEIHVIREYLHGANYLKQYLARGELQIIGATTVDEYRRYIERDPALERRFAPVYIDEPDSLDTIHILKYIRPRLEKFYDNVQISDSAIELAVELSHRYIHDRKQPDKAIDVIERSCVRVLTAASTQTQQADLSDLGQGATSNLIPLSVTEFHVRSIISEWTNIPDSSLTKEREKYLGLANDLKQLIFGQDDAIEQIVTTIRASIAGTVSKPDRPSGVFLFVGPTGVGKTELAKALATTLTGMEDNLVVLDMTGYRDSYTIASLVGVAKGNVDNPEVPTLTKLVRDHPYGVLLLDEIEKAHPEIWSLFMPVFDDGNLVDRQGTKIHFSNMVIIMTANMDVVEKTNKRFRSEAASFSVSSAADKTRLWKKVYTTEILKAIEEEFKFPREFVNRVDEIIVFFPLSKPVVKQILQNHIINFENRLGKKLNITTDAFEFLMDMGFKPVYGARELRRVIDRFIGTKLAVMKLKSDLDEWASVREISVVIDPGGDGLSLEPIIHI